MTVIQYNKCVDLYADGLYRFALKNFQDKDRAKDVVQDCYERLWIKVEEVNFEKVKSYLFSTAYHLIIDHFRREKKISKIDQFSQIGLTNNQPPHDLKEVIEEAVNRLPEIQKSALLLRDYEGYSYEEIGEITGLNESQVKVYIFRARTYLKNYIVDLDKVI